MFLRKDAEKKTLHTLFFGYRVSVFGARKVSTLLFFRLEKTHQRYTKKENRNSQVDVFLHSRYKKKTEPSRTVSFLDSKHIKEEKQKPFLGVSFEPFSGIRTIPDIMHGY